MEMNSNSLVVLEHAADPFRAEYFLYVFDELGSIDHLYNEMKKFSELN